MKLHLLTLFILLFGGNAFAGNYILTINGKDYEIDLDQQNSLKMADGRTLEVMLKKKPIVTFKTEAFSFDHPDSLTPSRTNLNPDINQTGMISPVGTTILIQEYSSIDPNVLIDMMIHELTKEEVNYGYKIDKIPVHRTLSNGITLTGKKVVSTYQTEESTTHVLCYRNRDSGLLIVTRIDKDYLADDQHILDLFWKSLKITPSEQQKTITF